MKNELKTVRSHKNLDEASRLASISEFVRQEQIEEFKREHIPPQHWRD